MDINDKITFLKKIDLLKVYLMIDDIPHSEVSSIFISLFIENIQKGLFESQLNLLKTEIDNNNISKSLNLTNELRENISRNLFKNSCKKDIGELIDTNNQNIKYCLDCHKNVFLVSNNDEIIKRRNLRQCVAINTFEFSKNEIPKNFRSCLVEYYEQYDIGLPK
jgi:hypothetical protein